MIISLFLVKREAIGPIELIRQFSNGVRSYDKFKKDLNELAKYHSEPYAFFVSQIISYVFRYDKKSNFYQTIQSAKLRFNITRPYVG